MSRFIESMLSSAESSPRGLVTGDPGSSVRFSWGEVHQRARGAASASGRSENVGYSTGFPEASPEATYSGTSGWENRFELSIWCPYEGRGRPIRTVDGWTTIESHADLFHNAFTICDDRQNAVHPRLYRQWTWTLAPTHQRGESVQDRRAAMLEAMLAVPFDGQHVVKRFFILPAPALIWRLSR